MFKTNIHGFISIVSKMFYKSIHLFDSAIKLIICYYIINIFTLKLVYYTFFLYNFTRPLKLIIMSVPSIPTNYTHNLKPVAPFDVDTTLDGSIESKLAGGFGVQHNGSLNTVLSGNLATNNVLQLKGDRKEPVITENKFDIENLPHFTLQDIKDLMKQRVRIPNYSKVCFKFLGIELFDVCMSGESQIITEPFVPNAAERCEDDCCTADTRPFPEIKGN